ncbi:MAG TPA: AIR synthase-related protein, partial [Roseiarcus sp.]|nr:AIR synthase-related protein [Roseiarcus sp.]
EMMLSESQERMLMVLHPEKEAEAEAIFRKWGLDFAIIGETTNTLRFVVKRQGEIKADLPIKQLGDQAPVYYRPWDSTPKPPAIEAQDVAPPMSNRDALLALLASPDFSSKRWVYEQYDTLILGNTVQGPGGDAAVVRLGDGPKGLALTTDSTPRYCEADPIAGGAQAVAEAWRNLIAVGARPLALTDNLNFGNPEKPDAMGQFVGCLKGIGEAATALDFPIVSGNVSFYNETSEVGILPTPAIGGVGLIENVAKAASIGLKASGEIVLIIGETKGWLGRSAYLETICGREEGAPPPVDLAAEKQNGEFIRALIEAGRVSAVHDVSDGGLAIALAEMAIAGNLGVTIDLGAASPASHAFLFGEDQGRYLVAARAAEAAMIVVEGKAIGLSIQTLGSTGGDSLTLPGEAPIPIVELRQAFESWLPCYMAGPQGGPT